ncbi:MAG TPA: hypothetical protein VIW45_18690 [Vicinamibacterales bacterium]
MFRFCAWLVSFGLLLAPVAEARGRGGPHFEVDRSKICAYNIGFTSVFSLFSAVAQHQVKSWRDVVRHIAIGAGAGAGYYQAKRLTGDGHVTAGWLLTNATASILENTTGGERLFGRVGYTVGPLRFRVATPLARTAIARIEADWSLVETGSFWLAIKKGSHVHWRNGLIAVDRDAPWPDPDIKGNTFLGNTFGVFPGVSPPAAPVIWHHEAIHAVQRQQFDSIEPPFFTFLKDEHELRPRRLFVFRHVRAGFGQALDLPTTNRNYHRRWYEIEAYALAERCPVLVVRGNFSCR